MTCWVACRSWRQASLSLWIAKGLNLRLSMVDWTPELKSDEMNTAFCGAEISTVSGKPACLVSFTYLLIFFCNSKLTASFICFYFWNNFLWTKVCWRANTKPNSFLVWMPSCHFWCLAVIRCPKSDLRMLKRRNLFTNYLSILRLCAVEVGIVMGNGADLGPKWEGCLMGMLRWSRFGLCIHYGHLQWDVMVSFQRQAVHHLPRAFQLDTFYCCMHLM